MFDLLEAVRGLRSALSEYADARRATSREMTSEAALVDLIAGLEELKSAAAAAQARAGATLAEGREQTLAGARGADERVATKRAVRGTASEIALARRESPHRGSCHLGLAKALTREMPHTYAALRAGAISEWRATLVVRETACLSREDRTEVDRRLAADAGRVEGWGDKRLVDQTRKFAYAIDPHAVVDRGRRAREDRHVSTRPAPDTMTWLSALLPVESGVACHAALRSTADRLRAAGGQRSRGQIMADTLVERVTGRAMTDGADVQVRLVLTDRTLLTGGSEPAYLEGYGTVPAQWARDLVRHALDRNDYDCHASTAKARVFIRQLYTHPVTGALVGLASRARIAPPGLAQFIATRDQTCRTPWCDAPVRHTDHVWGHAGGGPTSDTNLQGLCEWCNQTKQAPGWRARPSPGMRHLLVTTTPTGHTYHSTAPPLPGHEPSRAEEYLTDVTASVACDYRSA